MVQTEEALVRSTISREYIISIKKTTVTEAVLRILCLFTGQIVFYSLEQYVGTLNRDTAVNVSAGPHRIDLRSKLSALHRELLIIDITFLACKKSRPRVSPEACSLFRDGCTARMKINYL